MTRKRIAVWIIALAAAYPSASLGCAIGGRVGRLSKAR